MTADLITISIIGIVAGFIFSMPIAGPVSILITSNALKGRLKYCNLLATGASFADFLYVVVAVYGVSHLFAYFKSAIPYILLVGSLVLLFVGFKIIKAKFDIEHLDEEADQANEKIKKPHGALYTGFMVNILNPTLFFGWMISSFIALSFAASLGFSTGGLSAAVNKNLDQIEKIDKNYTEKREMPSYLQFDTLNIMKRENQPEVKPVKIPENYHLLVSVFYAGFLAIGSILWFSLLSALIVRFRKKININIINWIVRSMGIILCLLAVYFAFSAIKLLV